MQAETPALLFRQQDFRRFGGTVDNQLLADVMNGRCIQFRADFFQHQFALLAIVAEDLDLDQFMRLQTEVDFAQHLLGETIVAYHHHGVEIVAKPTQVVGLFGIQFNHRRAV
jgi:hypothetical protein